MQIPNSGAMDATATCGGPITFLPQIVTGDPGEILMHVGNLVRKAAAFAQIVLQLEQARGQLDRAWTGAAADSALTKITDAVSAFNQIIEVIEEGAALLGVSAGLVQAAQTAYETVVNIVNPVVQGLMSNPWTYAAAVALSTAASALLRGFIAVVEGLLQVMGAVKIAMQVMALVKIIQEIEALADRGSRSADRRPALHCAPVIAPPPPDSVGAIR